MKTAKDLLIDQRGMTGLETAIILIAFVTVAAVFGYAVLGSGLFAAERAKESHYSALAEAKSNMEIVGSVMGRSSDGVHLSSISFSLKNAIAGASIDLAPCDGTPSATNKCVISLTTGKDYLSNIKWNRQVIGPTNNNNLLEPGEQFEITIDLTDLGDNLSLSENLSANGQFTLQIKPAVGATLSIQRTLPPCIGGVIDLDLGATLGGGTGSGSSGGSGGATGTSLALYDNRIYAEDPDSLAYVESVHIVVINNGATSINMIDNYGSNDAEHTTVVSLTSDAGTTTDIAWMNPTPEADLLAPGATCSINIPVASLRGSDAVADLQAGETITITVTPQGGSTLTATGTLPNPLTTSMIISL